MTDQLTLRLDTDLPNLPEGLRPMLARPLAEPFDSAHHLFEPSWGGLRALAFVGPAETQGGGGVRIVDVEGVDRTAAFPELAGLAVRVDARSAILDGELVVVDAMGRADAGELARRLDGAAGRPVAYLVFDLLHVDGRSILSWPLSRRRETLRRILHAGDEVVAVPAIPGEGRALHDAAVGQGIAGIMARQTAGPYLPGIRSRLWRFIAAGVSGSGSLPEEAADAAAVDLPAPSSGAAPVLALIRRLPLDDGDFG
ncbi:MAG: hypothetical protein AABZ33_04480 [Chloroflexota bacterium]